MMVSSAPDDGGTTALRGCRGKVWGVGNMVE